MAYGEYAMTIYIYIYIYIERERERERETVCCGQQEVAQLVEALRYKPISSNFDYQ